jgi:hypothetical protein
MTPKRIKIIIAVSFTIVVVVIATAVGLLYQAAQSVPKPFAFSVSTYPNNGTIMTAQNLTIKVDAAYLEGTPEPVTLSASGGPNGTIYQFSNQTGTPTANQPFSSNLTISVPASAASGSYLIDVSSNISAQTCPAAFNLTVLAAEIQVSGNVTILSHVTINGVSIDVIPTDILFESNTTGQVYQAKINRFTDTSAAPGKTGNYSISLPNQQSYTVGFYCFSYPHFVPVFRVATGGIENGYFTVDGGAGVNATTANFTG